MNEKEKKPKFKLFEKLKNVKHIEIYVAIIFVVVVLLIYFSTMKKSSTNSSKTENSYQMTISSYVDNMETNLANVLSNINGVSSVSVMITLDMTNAEIQDSKISLSSFPDIKGIIITAKGVSSTSQKMKVLHAVEAVLDVKNGNIEILSSD